MTSRVLTTGRWLCSRCLSLIPPAGRSCPQCGNESQTPEYNPAALKEAVK